MNDTERKAPQNAARAWTSVNALSEPLVKALYDGSKDAHISTEVTFEDGRKGKIEADVKVRDVETVPVAAAMEKAA